MPLGPDTDGRDPVATRKAILSAALKLLAEDGINGLSIAQVARDAGVNRGTAYLHFGSREALITAAMSAAAADFAEALQASKRQNYTDDSAAFLGLFEQLSLFLMNNPGLARVWLNEIVLSGKRDQDPLSREWIEGCMGFAKSEKAQPGIDGAVLAMWTLGAMLLWPLWVEAATLAPDEKQTMARRFAREILRGSLYGNLRQGWSPNLEALLVRTTNDLADDVAKPV